MIKKICLFLAAIIPFHAASAIKVLSTRVIYDENKNEANIRVINYGETPHLVQTWVDSESLQGEAPFVVIPPVVKLNPDEGQTFRIIYTKDRDAHNDREIVYWLNLLDIPPKSKSSLSSNMMQFAVNTKIKLYYRPMSLYGKKPNIKNDIKWIIKSENKNTITATCKNESPFNYTFSNLVFEDGKNNHIEYDNNLSKMCLAKEETHYHFMNIKELDKLNKFHFHSINDYGGIEVTTITLESSSS